MDDDFLTRPLTPSLLGARMIRHWWVVLLLACLGGGIGLLVSLAMPARYVATAVLGIGQDPTLAQPLARNVQTLANYHIQDLVLSDATLQAARRQLGPTLAQKSLQAFRSHLRLDIVDTRWQFKVVDASPVDAATMANAWADAAQVQFDAAQSHALKAGELQALLFDVACQPEKVSQQHLTSVWVCGSIEPGVSVDQVAPNLLDEARLSQGILPSLILTRISKADPPQAPQVQARALLALAGTLVGILTGALAVIAGLFTGGGSGDAARGG